MQIHFYHVVLAAFVAATAACGRPAPADHPASRPPAPAATSPPAPPAAPAAGPATPTSDAIARGHELVERIRAAAGGAALTAIRSFDASGTSDMSVFRNVRTLSVLALYPGFFRMEEAPLPGGKGLRTAIGIDAADHGWMLGVVLSGEGRSNDPEVSQRAYTRAVRQTMAGFLAGINAPWLVDSGRFTPMASGIVDSGEDKHLLIVNLEGPEGRAGRLLVDPGTNLPRRFIEPPQPGTGGEAGRNEINFTYSDFRTESGAQLPHTIVRQVGNIRTLWSIKNYTINPKLAPPDFLRRGRR